MRSFPWRPPIHLQMQSNSVALTSHCMHRPAAAAAVSFLASISLADLHFLHTVESWHLTRTCYHKLHAAACSGRIVLEVFARHTMSRLFASFFDHILGQEASFFSTLSAGELMARTSGDSLTLRGMFTTTAYQVSTALILQDV